MEWWILGYFVGGYAFLEFAFWGARKKSGAGADRRVGVRVCLWILLAWPYIVTKGFFMFLREQKSKGD